MIRTENLRVAQLSPILSPKELKADLPATQVSLETVVAGREAIVRILSRADSRLLVLAGPCSIHDPVAAMDYARRLHRLSLDLKDRLCIVMRVYFEKPRTILGWKGLINDPALDGSSDMSKGLRVARQLLLDITALGLPAATEMLDPFVPQYIADLVSWAAIGARTTESQTHRQMASGLSMPVGFKNRTDGNIQPAIEAMASARHPHTFLGIDENGRICMVKTTGNTAGHLVMRGGRSRSNYDAESVRAAAAAMTEAGLDPRIMIDCSHGNTGKKFELQESVLDNTLEQRLAEGNRALIGVSLESNIEAGSQKIPSDLSRLQYGMSITDACIGWADTERLLRETHRGRTAAV